MTCRLEPQPSCAPLWNRVWAMEVYSHTVKYWLYWDAEKRRWYMHTKCRWYSMKKREVWWDERNPSDLHFSGEWDEWEYLGCSRRRWNSWREEAKGDRKGWQKRGSDGDGPARGRGLVSALWVWSSLDEVSAVEQACEGRHPTGSSRTGKLSCEYILVFILCFIASLDLTHCNCHSKEKLQMYESEFSSQRVYITASREGSRVEQTKMALTGFVLFCLFSIISTTSTVCYCKYKHARFNG